MCVCYVQKKHLTQLSEGHNQRTREREREREENGSWWKNEREIGWRGGRKNGSIKKKEKRKEKLVLRKE